MKRSVTILVCLALAGGCGTSAQQQAAAPALSTVSAKATAGSADFSGPVSLNAGWNAVAFQAQRLTALSANPAIAGFASYTSSGYDTRSLTAAEVNAAGGGRRAYWVFANAATSFTYSGVDDGEGNFTELGQQGYQLVSFCNTSDIPVSSITASQRGQSVNLGSVVSLPFYQIEANNTYTPVDATGVIKPGRAYWIFANTANGAVRLNLPAPTPSPTPALAVVSLSLSPTNTTVNLSSTVKFTLTAVLADGSVRDVTDQATWTSADPSVAALLSPGLFKAINAFPTTITASLGGKTAQTGLVVTNSAPPGPLPSPSPVSGPGLLYVANFNAGTTTSYPGALTLTGAPAAATTITGLANPEGIAVDGARNRLYVANNGDGTLKVFENASTATGAAVPVATITGFAITTSVSYDATNDRIYVGDQGNLRIFDNASTLTGALTVAAANRAITGFGANQISASVIDPANNRLFLLSQGGGKVVRIFDDAATVSGANGTVGGRSVTGATTGLGVGQPWGMSLDPGRQLLYISQQGGVLVFNNLATINGDQPFARQITGFPTNIYSGVVIDAARDILYVSNGLGTNVLQAYNNASTLNGAGVASRTFSPAGVNGPISFCIDFTR